MLQRVGINAVFLRPQMGGIETYVRRLMPELIALRPGTRFTLFVSAHGVDALRDEPWLAEVEVVRHRLLGAPYVSALSEMTLLAAMASRRRLDVLNSVALTGPWRMQDTAHVLTVGDVTWIQEPSSVPRVTGMLWRTLVPPIARRADRVLTYSEVGRRDVSQLLGVPLERVDAVALGPGLAESADPVAADELRRAHDLGPGPWILSVGSNRANKNPGRLVAALPRVRERFPSAQLVMSGPPNPFEETLRTQIAELGLQDAVRFPGYVSVAELEGLYRSAGCVAVPSTREGFGLVVLEAMRRGAPVACSRASSLPEVAGDAAEYFDPLDSADIARALVDVLSDPDRAARLAATGLERSRAFTWGATAVGTWESFERARHG